MAKRYFEAAANLANKAVARVQPEAPGAVAAWAAFQLSWGQMLLFAGVAEGTVGRALLPFAARALLEDGARWEWIRQRAVANPSGESLRAVVEESKRCIHRIREAMVSEGVRPEAIDRLLGYAPEFSGRDAGAYEVPPISDLLAIAYPNPSGVDSARVMYSVLSQFVHATPLALLHLQPDHLTSITAPIYAIAVEATCRGFFNIANATVTIACERDATIEEAFHELASALNDVRSDAALFHALG